MSDPTPPKKDQIYLIETVEGYLADFDRLAADIVAARQGAEALRRSLLADAFAGRLVRQDPNDEPASVLLDRIRACRLQGQALPGFGRRPALVLQP